MLETETCSTQTLKTNYIDDYINLNTDYIPTLYIYIHMYI